MFYNVFFCPCQRITEFLKTPRAKRGGEKECGDAATHPCGVPRRHHETTARFNNGGERRALYRDRAPPRGHAAGSARPPNARTGEQRESAGQPLSAHLPGAHAIPRRRTPAVHPHGARGIPCRDCARRYPLPADTMPPRLPHGRSARIRKAAAHPRRESPCTTPATTGAASPV